MKKLTTQTNEKTTLLGVFELNSNTQLSKNTLIIKKMFLPDGTVFYSIKDKSGFSRVELNGKNVIDIINNIKRKIETYKIQQKKYDNPLYEETIQSYMKIIVCLEKELL